MVANREEEAVYRILKQKLVHEKVQTISFPRTWRPLKFENQNGDATIWFEGDPDTEYTFRLIYLVFTGESVPEGARYLGTAFFGTTGELVIHAYYR